MKYLGQTAVIAAVTFLGEMLHILLPLPVPASVYGMILMFLALLTHVVREEQIADVAQWLTAIMPVMFIGPGVGIIEHYGAIADSLLAFAVIVFLTTVIVMAVTGLTVQGVMKIRKKAGDRNA